MSIINPHTGRPSSKGSAISDQELVQVLTAMRTKIDFLNQQNMQLGMYIEFIVDNLFAVTDGEGEQIFQMDIGEFPAFAEKRFAEIQEEVKKAQEAELQQQTEKLVAGLHEDREPVEVNLDE